MISAIVVAPDLAGGEDTGRLAEVVVRSLAWLVSAVVVGVVRDVTLAAPAGLGLSELADQAGCALVQEDRETDRLAVAIERARGPLLLILKTGFQPEAGLIDELDDLVRHEQDVCAVILGVPTTLSGRLSRARSRAIGLLAPADLCRAMPRRGFRGLVTSVKGARVLRHRATSIV